MTPLHQAAGKYFLTKKNQPRLHKTRVHLSLLPSPFNFLFEILQSGIHKTLLNLLLNSTEFMLSHCLQPLSLTFPVCSTCIFSIHPSSTCPILSDLLVCTIYKLCLKSSTTPHILCSPSASPFPFQPTWNSFHCKECITPLCIFFQGSLPLFPIFAFQLVALCLFSHASLICLHAAF